MDPDACLKELMELNEKVADIIDSHDETLCDLAEDETVELINDTCSLVEHVRNLNDWLKKGGFLPKDWNPSFRAP